MSRKLPRRLTWDSVGLLLTDRARQSVVVPLTNDREPDRRHELLLSVGDAEILGQQLLRSAQIARGQAVRSGQEV